MKQDRKKQLTDQTYEESKMLKLRSRALVIISKTANTGQIGLVQPFTNSKKGTIQANFGLNNTLFIIRYIHAYISVDSRI